MPRADLPAEYKRKDFEPNALDRARSSRGARRVARNRRPAAMRGMFGIAQTAARRSKTMYRGVLCSLGDAAR